MFKRERGDSDDEKKEEENSIESMENTFQPFRIPRINKSYSIEEVVENISQEVRIRCYFRNLGNQFALIF